VSGVAGGLERPAVRLAVLGDPLAFTLSPVLHRAGGEALAIDVQSEALRTPVEELGLRLRALAEAGYRGVNLTHPLKEAALAHVKRTSPEAVRARSTNTIDFSVDGWSGDTTDGLGFVYALERAGRALSGARVVLLGAGGAARSVALALRKVGAHVDIAARRPDVAAAAWRDHDVTPIAWPSATLDDALEQASVVVNATPLSAPDAPLDPRMLPRTAMAVDMVYGAEVTPWVSAARAAGLEAWDGLGMLVGQARYSFRVWFGIEPPFEALARAVGWPR
jgi:shikimate dehydrogenase